MCISVCVCVWGGGGRFLQSGNNSNNLIRIGRYEILTSLRKALGHDCRPSASPRADNHDLGLFCGPSKSHIALSNQVIVILMFPFNHNRNKIQERY